MLLWSHYSNSHTGFVVALQWYFLQIFFGQLWQARTVRGPIAGHKVIYTSTYPKLNGYTATQEEFLQALCTKSIDWSYEDEYRLIYAGGADQYMKIDRSILKRVILGCQINTADQEKIINILKDRGDHLPLFAAKVKEDSFALEFYPIRY